MRTLSKLRRLLCCTTALLSLALLPIALLSVFCSACICNAQSDRIELPFEYGRTQGDNPVTRLMAQIAAEEIVLKYDPHYGFLPSLLEAFEIPISSQGLVYSKTSLQAGRISPSNPRAIYFNDDVYVGWVQGSSLLEISTTDPTLGAAFYTIRMRPGQPVLRRENSCLACHHLPMTQGVPGHAVRSVLTRESGNINSLSRSFVTNHTSPFAERWGGWYVTGQLGNMQHMGNAFLEGDQLVPYGDPNRADLSNDIDTSRWLSPHSDIVALMVLEHQTQLQNTMTRANFEVRRMLQEAKDLPATERSATSNQVLDQAAKRVVDALLFVDEAKLDSAIKGSSTFETDFVQRGPFSEQGKSLREFDLRTRLFRYPCSYLIYSSTFNALEAPLQEQIYSRLWDVLSGADQANEYSHLSEPTRAATLEILQQTLPGLPDYWTNGR